LIIIASASVISYPWASSLLYGTAGAVESSAAPPRAADHAAADIPAGADASTRAAALDARAERQVPGWRIITRRVPRAADEPVTYTIDSGNGGQPQRQARLVLDPVSGEVMQWAPFSSGTRTSRLRSLLRYVHTGEVAGVAGQTLAGLVSLGTALLVWTGYALALRRLLGWRARQERTRQGMRDTRSSAT
ncbi:MAG: PepSY-associated TM helix domain-containing protein, partial [Gemmatimonadota bacterium]